MAEVTETSSLTDSTSSADAEIQTQDHGASSTADKVDYQSFRKSVEREKQAVARAQAAEERAQKLEQAQLEKEGKLAELVESLRAENTDLKKQNTQVVGKFAYKSVRSQLETEAAKVGCLNPNALAKLVDLNDFDVDSETFEASKDQMANAIESVRKENPWLFGKTSPAVNNSNPAVDASQTKVKRKPLREMSEDDLKNSLARLMKG